MNKWDLVDEDRRHQLVRELERGMVRIPWAERVNISALTGRAVQKIAPYLRTALKSWDTRVPTGQLNSWLNDLIAATPPPVRSGKQPKILFATQAQSRPPPWSSSPPASWKPATAASSNASSGKSSAFKAPQSESR
ncbi:hypothetical protein GCM10029964_093540 [Kibdelosporangium lantanae]